MHKQMKKENDVQTSPPPQQQTLATGPVYEEVSLPKEEIELKTNQAYGPVRQYPSIRMLYIVQSSCAWSPVYIIEVLTSVFIL